MPRKKKPELSFAQKMQKLLSAGLNANKTENVDRHEEPIGTLSDRVKQVLGLAEKNRKEKGSMLFFVMYDIENNKVRRLIVKYLQRKGCYRVQKSIFLAEASYETYNSIKNDLSEVQAAYDNDDSIFVLPVSTDYLQMMKIIGKEVNVDVITRRKSTLFF